MTSTSTAISLHRRGFDLTHPSNWSFGQVMAAICVLVLIVGVCAFLYGVVARRVKARKASAAGGV